MDFLDRLCDAFDQHGDSVVYNLPESLATDAFGRLEKWSLAMGFSCEQVFNEWKSFHSGSSELPEDSFIAFSYHVQSTMISSSVTLADGDVSIKQEERRVRFSDMIDETPVFASPSRSRRASGLLETASPLCVFSFLHIFCRKCLILI